MEEDNGSLDRLFESLAPAERLAALIEQLTAENLSQETIIKRLAEQMLAVSELRRERAQFFEVVKQLEQAKQGVEDMATTAQQMGAIAERSILQKARMQQQASVRGKRAAQARHGQPGGSRDKREAIQKIWLEGKYSSRDLCAEEECAALNMSFSAARKALRGLPDPT